MSVFRGIRPALRIAAWAAMLWIGYVGACGAADEPKPKEADSKARYVPPQITFTTKVSPAKVKPGGTVTYSVTATLDPTWHVYAYYPEKPKNDDLTGVATEFDLFQTDGLTASGDWTASKPATKSKESLNYHEDAVTWTLKLKVPADAPAGKKTIRNQVHFMICDPTGCKPPAYKTVPEATVTVAAGGAAMLQDIDQAALISVLVATEATVTKSDVPEADPIDRGLIPFLVWCALGGLVAVLMPCVWPMIPITVNFFVKQGEADKANSIKLAVAYCLAIIGIFTSLGLLVTFFMGASGAQDLGNNPWLNLIMGVAFIAMGMMLLGLFEVRLPGGLLNVTSHHEGQGGWVGVMFMAATLTITSFTCTAPVVGSLLGQAVKGKVLYPVLGMLTFSAVLSLPFFVLALVPSLMKKMPRSGDWMNAVKVVGGLVEIAAAFKFLNTAEISFGTNPGDAWIDANVIVTAWVVSSLVCGIYLLGLFRTDHDGDVVKVGPMRLMMGMVFLGMSLYLAPALFGKPPQSRFYDQIAGILPPDSSKFDEEEKEDTAKLKAIVAWIKATNSRGDSMAQAGVPNPSAPILDAIPRKATSPDPKVAIREEKRLHGVIWGLSYEDALAEAKRTGKLVLVDFTGVFCTNCRTAERSIFPKPEVVEELKKFVTVQLYTDRVDIASIPAAAQRELAEANYDRETQMTGDTTSPLYVVLSPEGKFLAKTGFGADHGFLLRFLKDAQGKYRPGEKVAMGDGKR